ncbi:protein of unknown function [uncultured Woeseiaceae bacterium]|uniref:Uncharacterized protein n=1 Tax=uncultured Woeseiaceae bacterium TaxID=1983305 RepID=A0A7D9H6F6_9GAMM|nr:protein of unknown function [uncultured Woeseiaceae bacterium]
MDSEDLKLEALFRSEPVLDDGFSVRIVSRVRRRMWVRRLSLPTAFAIGAIIAAKPLAQLVSLVPKLVSIVPQNLMSVFDWQLGGMFQGTTITLGIMLFAALLMIWRMLEE